MGIWQKSLQYGPVIQQWWNSGWVQVARSLLLSYLTIAGYAYFFSDRQIFFPQLSSYPDSPNILRLTTADGVRIAAVHLPNPQATFTILYSHGNGEDLGDIRFVLEYLQQNGFAVFAYDYRGYGLSEGTPSTENAYRDIDAAYNYLTEVLKLPPQRIIVHGRSVGSGPSVYLASRQPVAGLVLESAFVSAFRVMTQIPILPFEKFPNIDRLGQVRCPVLIIHGTQDTIIPFWHGQALFQAANEPKRLVPIPEAGHNDLVQVAGDRYAKILQEFAASL
jgi:fermentation-respiration switch protein FrsA (DUF1100 family)